MTMMIIIQGGGILIDEEIQSADHRLGGENPFYGAHMMQILLDQQAKRYFEKIWSNYIKVYKWKLYHFNAII